MCGIHDHICVYMQLGHLSSAACQYDSFPFMAQQIFRYMTHESVWITLQIFPPNSRLNNLYPRALEAVKVGYSNQIKLYNEWDTKEEKPVITHDVTFDEYSNDYRAKKVCVEEIHQHINSDKDILSHTED